MREQLETLMRDSEVTQLAVSMIDDGQLSETYIFGDSKNHPLKNDTIWTVASLTKPVFVYGVMLLAQRGIIDMDRPMQDYLPNAYTDDVFAAQMTIRHAMSHSTGFPNWRGEEGLQSSFVPGTKFSYSSEGLTFLQYVIEHIIQMPLYDYLQQNVFEPLKMNNTDLQLEEQKDLPPMLHFLTGSLLANGALSLRTTIIDYARFVSAMFDTASSTALLNQANLKEMLRPQVPIPDVPNLHWGLGWGLQNISSQLSFWHWGARSIPKTMNFVMGIPSEQKAIIIFTNHQSGLYLCNHLIELWAGKTIIPAFEWLLPAHEWRPDGKKQR